ncbi:MAG: rod shape-determining protein MreC [Candidatus Eremiobacteraeota bacterium]|nr:rod shape-determining protein MreC [Candidatus Eremiobacteraeota bacterium]MBC5826350.1 rod shape-determining protein MreC [Candidatus Eremiobacteraeota bacterium]
MVAIHSFWDERKLLVFVALIIIAAASMLLELNAFRAGRQSLMDEFVASAVLPVEYAASHAATTISSEAIAIAHARSFAARNAALERELGRLNAANGRLRSAAAENGELRRLLAMRAQLPRAALSADVVGYEPEGERKEITIDRGFGEGVQRDAVVVGADGLVGHVIDAGPHEARVLLITDPTSAVPAYLQKKRSWGIVTGTWQHVRMKYIGQDVRVQPGDFVVTGPGHLYPGGIPIGRVRQVDRKDSALYQMAFLDPTTDFASLTHVLVLKNR